MKRILLHIGYHKTGTTWLQRDFFTEKYGFTQILSHEDVSDPWSTPTSSTGARSRSAR